MNDRCGEAVISVQLENSEYEYLISLSQVPRGLDLKLQEDCTAITLRRSQLDLLLGSLGDRLQTVGFDHNYELTAEGEIIEDIITKLTCDEL